MLQNKYLKKFIYCLTSIYSAAPAETVPEPKVSYAVGEFLKELRSKYIVTVDHVLDKKFEDEIGEQYGASPPLCTLDDIESVKLRIKRALTDSGGLPVTLSRELDELIAKVNNEDATNLEYVKLIVPDTDQTKSSIQSATAAIGLNHFFKYFSKQHSKRLKQIKIDRDFARIMLQECEPEGIQERVKEVVQKTARVEESYFEIYEAVYNKYEQCETLGLLNDDCKEFFGFFEGYLIDIIREQRERVHLLGIIMDVITGHEAEVMQLQTQLTNVVGYMTTCWLELEHMSDRWTAEELTADDHPIARKLDELWTRLKAGEELRAEDRPIAIKFCGILRSDPRAMSTPNGRKMVYKTIEDMYKK